jgi:hypothetical protein
MRISLLLPARIFQANFIELFGNTDDSIFMFGGKYVSVPN